MKRTVLLCGLCLGLLTALPLQAADAPIARIPTVGDNPTDPTLRAEFEAIRAKGGQIINLQRLLGLAPKLSKAHQEEAFAIRFDAVTPRPLRELAIMRVSQMMGGTYEIIQHRPMLAACGFSAAQQAALADWRGSTLFDDKERAELAYVEAVVKGGEVDDATFNAFAHYFSPQEIVEVTLTIGNYVASALLTKALELRPDSDGSQSAMGKC